MSTTTGVTEGTIAVSTGINLAYRSIGEGPPLLMITGTSATIGLWASIEGALAANHRVISFDNRGLGGSERSEDPVTMTGMAEDAAALMDALGIERADVLGWSLGSCVAQELALAHPDKVAALVLFGTWDHLDGFQRAVFAALTTPWRIGDVETGMTALGLSFSPEFLDSPEFAPTLESMADLFPTTPDQIGVTIEQFEADAAHDSRGRLGDIQAPVLVVVGEQDLLTPPWQGRKVADAIPGAEFHLFTGPGSSHALNLERPEEFSGVVLDFLERSPLR